MKRKNALLKNAWNLYRHDWLASFGVLVMALAMLMAVLAPWLAPYAPTQYLTDPATGRAPRLVAPNTSYWFGTNNLGQDLFSQFVYGVRPVIIIGVVGAVLATSIGTVVGAVAGYFGRWVDAVFSRAIDVAYSLPFETSVLVLIIVFGPGTRTIILGMTLLMWRSPARIARAQVLSLREEGYVLAARSVGSSKIRIIFTHLLPAVFRVNSLYFAVAFGWGVAAEATIGFLGFGDPGTISWGVMLNEAFANGAQTSAWWWITIPGAGILVLVAAAYFIIRPLDLGSSNQKQGSKAVVAS